MAAPQPIDNYENDNTMDTLRNDSDIIADNLFSNCCATLIDDINAAWNGWESACKFQDDNKASYYMKYIVILQDALEKIRKHEARYNI